jgi:hypothetical protein
MIGKAQALFSLPLFIPSISPRFSLEKNEIKN